MPDTDFNRDTIEETAMEIKSAINDVNGIVKLYWQDLLGKEWIVSNSAQDGRMGGWPRWDQNSDQSACT
jgi:hypothetical protein